ncbi:restriction endonuclease subunit S [Nocardia sp. NPDC051911]|uniref:restriction endonuclease subunit S n=1 Tax=Nocardia sp. NPDC051911 TaxID=3154648 RepID=UPI00343E4754
MTPLTSKWPTKSLAELGARVTSGSRGWASYYADHGSLFVRITNLNRNNIYLDLTDSRFVDVDQQDAEAIRTRLAPGDILISITADIGIVGYVDEAVPSPAYINQHIARVRLNPELANSRFVAYYLSSWGPQRKFVGATDTGAKAGMNLTTVASLTTVAPPLEEQDRIAEVLTDVDRLIAAQKRIIAKKQAVKHGVMQQLLTGRTRLPGFSDPWVDVRLGDHVTYVKTVPLSRAQLDDASPLRYLHYGDIHTHSGATFDAARESMPRAAAHLARRAGRLEPGDLVFADASEDPVGVGKSVEIASVPSEGVVPGLHTIAARFDKSVLANGFKGYLQFIPAFREPLLRLVAGTKVLATTRSQISSIALPLPSAAEQKAIAVVLSNIDSEITALCVRLAKMQDIKRGVMQELLTGRVRLPIGRENE